jgi:uncharacterized repeat protein (TIGR03847 family)
MTARTFLFDPPDRFVAGAVGEPGRRTFFLQAVKGRAVLTVALEKVQVALLAERIGALGSEAARPSPVPGEMRASLPPLAEPIVAAFRVGSMTLTYDEERRDVTVEAQEIGDGAMQAADPAIGRGASVASGHDHDDDEEELDVLRVRLPLDDAVRFAAGALQVVAAGRPPCPLCGEPLDPQGHICARRNGYVM